MVKNNHKKLYQEINDALAFVALGMGWIIGPPMITYMISQNTPKEYFTDTCIEIQTAEMVKGLETEVKNFLK